MGESLSLAFVSSGQGTEGPKTLQIWRNAVAHTVSGAVSPRRYSAVSSASKPAFSRNEKPTRKRHRFN